MWYACWRWRRQRWPALQFPVRPLQPFVNQSRPTVRMSRIAIFSPAVRRDRVAGAASELPHWTQLPRWQSDRYLDSIESRRRPRARRVLAVFGRQRAAAVRIFYCRMMWVLMRYASMVWYPSRPQRPLLIGEKIENNEQEHQLAEFFYRLQEIVSLILSFFFFKNALIFFSKFNVDEASISIIQANVDIQNTLNSRSMAEFGEDHQHEIGSRENWTRFTI